MSTNHSFANNILAARAGARRLLLPMAAVLGMLLSSQAAAAEMPVEAKGLLIQHNGRVKTFEAFARQTVRLVSGKEKWDKREASELLWDVMMDRSKARTLPWIRIDLPELKTRVGLRGDEARGHFFTLEKLAPSFPAVIDLARSAKAKRDADERPTAVEQKAEQLLNRMYTVDLMISGELFTIAPPAEGAAWTTPFAHAVGPDLADAEDHTGHDHGPGEAHPAPPASAAEAGRKPVHGAFERILSACGAEGTTDLCAHEIQHWNESVRNASPEAAKARVTLELFHLFLRPFQWAWIFYFAGFLFMLFRRRNTAAPAAGASRSSSLVFLGIVLAVAGWAFHTLGLAQRVLILDRPPVSNMYESMIFMNWALMLFAFIFAAVRRTTAPLGVGALVSALIEIYANLLPIDPSMDVLVPVLRSNYWLTVHVLTVVASYGAFGLALALGHRQLIFTRLTPRWSAAEEDASARLILRVIELGVILIGVGTVLGGVWANESWGRFWGWDPKETWALITLLGYLAIIHLRYFKKIGPFGLAVGTIIGFQLVLFTWYGVNFVLGRGLHSYGSGSGGMNWILYYLAAQTVFLAAVFLRKK